MSKSFFIFVFTVLFLSGCTNDDKSPTALQNNDPENFSVSVSEITTSSAFLQWEAVTDLDDDPISYTVYLEGTELETFSEITMYTITGLSPGTFYSGSIEATDGEGGSTSSSFSFTTYENGAGESGSVIWQKTYGGSGNDDAYTICALPDGGYVVAGSSDSPDGDISNPIGNKDAWIIKLNEEGEIVWETTIGGSNNDTVHDIQPTADGGFIVGAFSSSDDIDINSNQGMRDYWIVKLSASGSIEWSVNPGSSSDEILESIIQTSQGEYIAVGFTLSDDLVSGDKADAWIVKIDQSGVILWSKSFGDLQNDNIFSIIETNDLGFMLCGYTTTSDNKREGWLIKLDIEGNFEWEKLYGGSENDELIALSQTQDNGYILGGYSQSDIAGYTNKGSSDIWILKVDETGNILWQKTQGSTNFDVINSIVQLPDSFVFAGSSAIPDGFTGETNGASDFLILKTDTSGNTIWQRSLGDEGDDYAASIALNNSEELVITGSLYTNIVDQGESSTGDHDFVVFKLKN